MSVATASALDRLREAVGGDAIVTDPAELDYLAQDVHSLGPIPLCAFRPGSTELLAAGVAAAHRAGLAIVPRGGGMSYTSGFVPTAAGAMLVDLAAMDRILDVDADNMTVTVEAGCTWAALYRRLHPLGLRAPLWGTLSGSKATIGGGMSQNGLFWGAGRGTIAHQALAMTVVLADGRIVRTGHDVARPFGPDVTGLFAADAGAFGIKAEITLPLIREAVAFAYGSFAFDTAKGIFGAMAAVARDGLASEAFGFDPFLTGQRMRRDSLAADAKSLVGMMKAQAGFWKAVKEGARVVAAGRSFLDESWSAHFIAEGRIQAAADADMAAIRAACLAAGGREVENTIPKILRANPFPPVNSMVGPAGERWVPVHGIVDHRAALPALAAIIALFEAHEAEMEALGVGAGYMLVTVATTGFLIEPVFYFPDTMQALHRRSLEPAHLARLPGFAANPEARALVDRLRAGVVELFGRHNAAHFQIGRTYPLRDRIDPIAWDLLGTLKQALDPDRRMNPGALAL